MFKGRNLLIATKHKKELVITPVIENILGVKCFVNQHFDTDSLGTFTGEIERKDDPLTTARNKCLMAMELENFDLAISNEGSFGLHPNLFFTHADDEIIYFIDKKNDLEIFARLVSTETNFNGNVIEGEEQLVEFAKATNFPSHGLIIKKTKDDWSEMVKGITDWDHLLHTFQYFKTHFESAYLETDMRAMYNPSRMKVIEQATKKLVDTITSYCPECRTPGFRVISTKQGLPCDYCGSPTRSTLSYIYKCQKCTYTREKMYPHDKINEDPMYCDRCNP